MTNTGGTIAATIGPGSRRPRDTRTVNNALRAAGHDERVRYDRANGYFYFAGGMAGRWPVSGVYVPRVADLTIAQWVAERDRLAAAIPDIDDD